MDLTTNLTKWISR